MSKERILLQIEAYINKVRTDYQNNVITGFQFEMLYRELTNLIKNIDKADALITVTKFETIKTVYIIMK